MIGYGFVFDRDTLFQVGGFKYLGFSPIPGDSGSNLTFAYFSNGLVQPPTSYLCVWLLSSLLAILGGGKRPDARLGVVVEACLELQKARGGKCRLMDDHLDGGKCWRW